MDKYENSEVVKLCLKDFKGKKFVNKKLVNKNGLIKFYANWCSHCNNLVEPLSFLAKNLKDNDFFIGVIDIDKNKELAKRFNVSGIPTIYTKKGNNLEEFKGERDMKSLLDHICKFTN